MPRRRFRSLRLTLSAALVAAIPAMSGCAGQYALAPLADTAGLAADLPRVSWLGPVLPRDASHLVRWRRAVGAPLVVGGPDTATVADRIVVVNWNMHVGGGDLRSLYSDVRGEFGTGVPVVFLLQEAFRSGADVPSVFAAGAAFPPMIRSLRRDGQREHIAALATSLGLHAYYVPSMRNGGPPVSDEDRGNAILSTMPLADLSAIELPFESQRRVAVSARISGTTPAGAPWQMRVVSAHLDNMAGARRLWIAGGEFGRTRQARGLVSALAGGPPLVLGADLNSWFGFQDAAYLETARAFPQTRVADRRATFHGLLRLDHLFFRLEDGWTANFRRAAHDYGSDHYPLIGTVEIR